MRHPLLLVPTDLERSRIEPVLAEACGGAVSLDLCGFGPVVAAARTARLIADRRPDRVLLVGIAGRYAERLAIGQAYAFERVACHGIGAGSGAAFTPAAALGWPQWPGDGLDRSTKVADALPCASGPLPAAAPARAGLLLSACAAAGGAGDVRERLALQPDAEAEDMEGFAVATACRLAGVPLDIVRGISNTAGDRDHSRWQIDAACHAAARLAALVIGGRP
ncbi:MAG: futalosine hydrolase [Planctomycetia bacterium]